MHIPIAAPANLIAGVNGIDAVALIKAVTLPCLLMAQKLFSVQCVMD